MKNSRFSKALVIVIIIMNSLFTVYVLEVFKITQSEPTTMILSWFGFTTGELMMLCSIKKKKIKTSKNSKVTENNQDE